MDKKSRIQELKQLIQEKKEQIEIAKREGNKFNSLQLALKLVLNGSYGAFANKHFVVFCNGVAATITAHGRDLIKLMDKAGNHYFTKKWHKDVEVHKLLGVEGQVEKLDAKGEYCVYVDTDSNFFTLKPAMESCGWEGDPLEFVHIVSKHGLQKWFAEVLQKYAEKFTVENVQNFELEQVSKSIIFLEKKMYIKNVVWEDGSPNKKNPSWQPNGSFFDGETNLQAKGIDLVRSSAPLFSRIKCKEVIKYFFQNPTTYNDRDLVRIMKKLKDEFKIVAATRIEDVSSSSSCSKYTQGVMNDQDDVVVVSGAHFAVKAAALHNYVLNQNPKYKSKYNLIKGGTKVKLYATTHPKGDTFAFVQGMYPREVAEQYAPMDIDRQFDKTVLGLINRFNKVLGLSELNPQLTYAYSLF
jgi:DNA polymerase elongation subunit (family B)